MNDTVKLIDQLIEEHRVKSEMTRSLVKMANDATALQALQQVREDFVPGRLGNDEAAGKLKEKLEDIHVWLDRHFNREETALLVEVEKTGERKIISTLKALLDEHSDLRQRIGRSGGLASELTGGGLAAHRWNATANDLRAHINHTQKVLENHARRENRLFRELRQYFLAKDTNEEGKK